MEIRDEEKPHVQLERDCSAWMIVRRVGREHRMTTAMVIAGFYEAYKKNTAQT